MGLNLRSGGAEGDLEEAKAYADFKQAEGSVEGENTTRISVKHGGQSGVKRKKGKVIKESLECPNLVFGVDLHFDSVMAASKSILVGRARGKFSRLNT